MSSMCNESEKYKSSQETVEECHRLIYVSLSLSVAPDRCIAVGDAQSHRHLLSTECHTLLHQFPNRSHLPIMHSAVSPGTYFICTQDKVCLSLIKKSFYLTLNNSIDGGDLCVWWALWQERVEVVFSELARTFHLCQCVPAKSVFIFFIWWWNKTPSALLSADIEKCVCEHHCDERSF